MCSCVGSQYRSFTGEDIAGSLMHIIEVLPVKFLIVRWIEAAGQWTQCLSTLSHRTAVGVSSDRDYTYVGRGKLLLHLAVYMSWCELETAH